MHAYIRVDQSGYVTRQRKYAYVMAPQRLATGAVVDVVSSTGRQMTTAKVERRKAWSSRFPYVYSLDFSTLVRAGRYSLVLRDTTVHSPPFMVSAPLGLWKPVLTKGLAFFRLQRDGTDVIAGSLQRKPAHRNDGSAQTYRWPHFEPDSDTITDSGLTRLGGRVDVEGGWFDAGDSLKFTHSTAYADVLLYTAARDLGRVAPASLLAEARHGTQWLAKMWDRPSRTLNLQVGIGSGNSAGTFFGDHDLWRLPETDDHNSERAYRYATAHRPVFQASAAGRPISPNLAGRVSAAFALAAQADATTHPARARDELKDAISVYTLADTKSPPEPLVTALPNAFYPEDTWRDDMELGAVEIANAQRSLGHPDGSYVRAAALWARSYIRDETGDTFNLYDVSALAHVRLAARLGHRHLGVSRAALVGDVRRQLTGAARRSVTEPFRGGVDDTEFDVDSHTLGLVATAGWYRSMTGDGRFDGLTAALRGWVFGANAWGMSFMVGVGTTYPRCLQHQVANLRGSTDGKPPVATGAVVNGPNGVDVFSDGLDGFQDGMVHCSARLASVAGTKDTFDGSGSRYLDDARAWQTNEPALDMTGAAIVAAAAQLSH